ncbi:MAG: hypothetical protein K2X81_08990, partial [Candidatus Obscuribacterales bacterium]|nr:hypothetical protein [Candidatus Obscuribacterales bacterium]
IDLSHGAAAKIGVTGVSPVICVAYAGESEPELIAKSNLSRSGKHKHRRNSTLSGAPAKVSPKVLHYIAGVM